MLDRLNKDAVHLHEDMISQLHQMQDTVRYTFFECFLTLAGNSLLTRKFWTSLFAHPFQSVAFLMEDPLWCLEKINLDKIF